MLVPRLPWTGGSDITQSSPNLPPDFRALEAKIEGLSDVIKCHITEDGAGGIAEVHVVAAGERKKGKHIVRDVETVLITNGVRIDHRKISVANLQRPDPSAPIEAPRIVESVERGSGAEIIPLAPPEPRPAHAKTSRLRYIGMNVKVTGTGCHARVELTRGHLSVPGDSSTPAGGNAALRSIAEATLRAVMHCYEAGPALTIEEIAFVTLLQKQVVIVSVGCHAGRDTVHLLGSTFVGHDPQQAVIFATLDAINRYSGRLKEREFTEYEVGPAPARS